MTQEEIYGTRDLSYSFWHRSESTARFLGMKQALELAQIDMDLVLYIEYDDKTKEPIALIEAAKDVNQKFKPYTVTRNLAVKSNLPAFVVLYTVSKERNPIDTKYFDISNFRIKQIYPNEETDWEKYTPQEWAEKLLSLRKIKNIPREKRKGLRELRQNGLVWKRRY